MDNPDPPLTDKPQPPPGPENRVQCSSCGFTAPKSEFEARHKSCTRGMINVISVSLAVVAMWALIALVASGKLS